MYRERRELVPGAYVWTGNGGGEMRVLPDGCMDLIWRNSEITSRGRTREAHVVAGEEGSTAVGLRFAPGFGPRVIGVPARQLADARVSLTGSHLVVAATTQRLVERLAESDNPDVVLEAIALEYAGTDDPDALLVDHIARRARRGDQIAAIAAPSV